MGFHPEPPQVRILHLFRCCSCTMMAMREFNHQIGYEAVKPEPPERWRVIDGMLYCPNHRVVVRVENV